jgi:uncharacterized protein YdaU (DUF1376 family)
VNIPARNESIVKAARLAVEREGQYFVLLLDFYLKDNYGEGLELVARDRRKFRAALKELLGDERAGWLDARIDEQLKKLKVREPNQQG